MAKLSSPLSPLIALLSLIGCSAPAGPTLTPVSGVVTLGAKPVGDAWVKFLPQGTTPGHGGMGRTDSAGRYEAIANRENRKGLPPGEYKVVVTRLIDPAGKPIASKVAPIDTAATETVPEPFCRPQLTPLAVTVGTEAKTFDIPLERP